MSLTPGTWMRRAALLAAMALLAACGGGSQVDPFHPRRMIVFGDQTSAIESDGRKYTVNYFDFASDALDCKQNPNWVQIMSNDYGFSFEQCHGATQTPESLLYSKNGAKAADIETQIDAHLAADKLTGDDLVTLSVGINDVKEQYDAYAADPAAGTDAMMKVLSDRGAALAKQVQRLTDTGAKVVVVRTYSLGVTPFAAKEAAAHVDEDNAAGRPQRNVVLASMSEEFNISLLVAMPDDGTKVATVDAIATINAMFTTPQNFGLDTGTINVDGTEIEKKRVGLCIQETPECQTRRADLVEYSGDDGTNYTTPLTWLTYLWADDLNLSPRGHQRIGQIALSRATNNPFR